MLNVKRLFPLLLAVSLLLSQFGCAPAVDTAMADAIFSAAEKYLLDLEYEQAVITFDEAIKIDPKDPRGMGIVDALLHEKRPEDAVQYVKDHQNRDPKVTLPAPSVPATLVDLSAGGEPGNRLYDLLERLKEAILRSVIDGLLALADYFRQVNLGAQALNVLRRTADDYPDEVRVKAALAQLAAVMPEGKTAVAAESKTEAPKPKYLLARRDFYNADGSRTYTTFQYNADGKESRRDFYKSEGSLSYYDTYQYDANGNLTRHDFYESEGSLSSYDTYQYDENGKRTRWDIYYSGGSHTYETRQYDENGKSTRWDIYYSDGSHSYGTSQYDANGNLTRTDNYNSDVSHSYTTFQYDANGKPTRTDDYNYDSAGSHSYTTYQYDANGNTSRTDRYGADSKLTSYYLDTYIEA